MNRDLPPTSADRARWRTRRGFLRDLARLGGGMAGLGLLASCAPTPSPTAPSRVHHVGLLYGGLAESTESAEFWGRMAELGYVEGQNLVREERASLAQRDDAAAELVRLPVDVIVALGLPSVRAAMDATASIPIVMMGGGDPVAGGLVDSLARPGRNLTGISRGGSAEGPFGLDLKRLELLAEAAPDISKVAVFGMGEIPGGAEPLARSVAGSLGVDLVLVPVTPNTSREDYEAAFERIRVEGADAVLIRPGGGTGGNDLLIASLAERYRLPGVSANRAFVTSGLLMAYEARGSETQRRAADYVDRILRGARPADLPIEQARGYDLIVNMRSARALRLTLSQDFLDQVTEVIE